MSMFSPKPTTIAEWHSLVAEAELKTGYRFNADLENYLILTLDHYTKLDGVITSVIAFDFLKSTQIESPRDGDLLRDVGDRCLILSGLFPENANQRNVSLSYFIGMGRQAYLILSDARLKDSFDPMLYKELSINFVGLMDLLHSMRS